MQKHCIKKHANEEKEQPPRPKGVARLCQYRPVLGSSDLVTTRGSVGATERKWGLRQEEYLRHVVVTPHEGDDLKRCGERKGSVSLQFAKGFQVTSRGPTAREQPATPTITTALSPGNLR